MSGSSETGSLKEGGCSIFSYSWGREGYKKKTLWRSVIVVIAVISGLI